MPGPFSINNSNQPSPNPSPENKENQPNISSFFSRFTALTDEAKAKFQELKNTALEEASQFATKVETGVDKIKNDVSISIESSQKSASKKAIYTAIEKALIAPLTASIEKSISENNNNTQREAYIESANQRKETLINLAEDKDKRRQAILKPLASIFKALDSELGLLAEDGSKKDQLLDTIFRGEAVSAQEVDGLLSFLESKVNEIGQGLIKGVSKEVISASIKAARLTLLNQKNHDVALISQAKEVLNKFGFQHANDTGGQDANFEKLTQFISHLKDKSSAFIRDLIEKDSSWTPEFINILGEEAVLLAVTQMEKALLQTDDTQAMSAKNQEQIAGLLRIVDAGVSGGIKDFNKTKDRALSLALKPLITPLLENAADKILESIVTHSPTSLDPTITLLKERLGVPDLAIMQGLMDTLAKSAIRNNIQTDLLTEEIIIHGYLDIGISPQKMLEYQKDMGFSNETVTYLNDITATEPQRRPNSPPNTTIDKLLNYALSDNGIHHAVTFLKTMLTALGVDQNQTREHLRSILVIILSESQFIKELPSHENIDFDYILDKILTGTNDFVTSVYNHGQSRLGGNGQGDLDVMMEKLTELNLDFTPLREIVDPLINNILKGIGLPKETTSEVMDFMLKKKDGLVFTFTLIKALIAPQNTLTEADLKRLDDGFAVLNRTIDASVKPLTEHFKKQSWIGYATGKLRDITGVGNQALRVIKSGLSRKGLPVLATLAKGVALERKGQDFQYIIKDSLTKSLLSLPHMINIPEEKQETLRLSVDYLITTLSTQTLLGQGDDNLEVLALGKQIEKAMTTSSAKQGFKIWWSGLGKLEKALTKAHAM